MSVQQNSNTLNQSSTTTFLKGRLNTFRLYTLACGILVVGLKVVVTKPEAFDPMWLRGVVGGYFLVILAMSYFVKQVAEDIAGYFAFGVMAIGTWLGVLLWGNNFHADYMSGYNIMSVSSVLLFDNRRYMAMFTTVSAATLILAGIFCEIPPDPMWAFVGLNLIVFVIGNLAIAARVNTRSKMELDLRNSLTIQEAAIESNRDALLMVDVNGKYLKSNISFCELWGIPQTNISQQRMQETEQMALTMVMDPEKLKSVWATGEQGQGADEPHRVAFKDGRVIEMHWRPMANGTQTIGRLWFFRDVTAQWRHEQTLLNTEKQLRHQNEMLMEFASSFAVNAGNLEEAFREITSVSSELLDVDTVGVWYFETQTDSMRLELQYDRLSDAYGKGVEVALADHPEYFAALFKNKVFVVNDTAVLKSTAEFAKGKYSGKAAALMHAQIRARGESIGVLSFECATNAREWTLEEQNYASSLADLVSISIASEEKQKAQDGLNKSIAILQAIFDLSETGIIVEDADHNILNYNELYLKIWGMTKEFVDTQPYKSLVDHCLSQLKNSTSYEEGLQKLKLRPGMEYAGIMEFHDGKFVERYSKAIQIGEDVKGRVWFYLDITERKRKENELINRNFELDSFVYRASHDLKAPLNSIMGLISLIREEKELDQILAFVTMMDKSVKKLDDFIKQLTQFSQDVRLNVVCKSLDFIQLLEEVLADLKFMDNAGRLTVNLNVEQTGKFYSDPVRLGIILANLISNSIKYQDLKKTKSTLDITVKVDDLQAECIFADNGVGISAEHLEKVFDLFFRASVQATGTGLGLYITHNAIQRLGGTIKVASKLGEGTTFTLILPSFTEVDEFKPGPQGLIDASPV